MLFIFLRDFAYLAKFIILIVIQEKEWVHDAWPTGIYHVYWVCRCCGIVDVVADLSSLVQCEDVDCVNYAVSQKKISDVFSRNSSEHCPVVIILAEVLPR